MVFWSLCQPEIAIDGAICLQMVNGLPLYLLISWWFVYRPIFHYSMIHLCFIKFLSVLNEILNLLLLCHVTLLYSAENTAIGPSLIFSPL